MPRLLLQTMGCDLHVIAPSIRSSRTIFAVAGQSKAGVADTRLTVTFTSKCRLRTCDVRSEARVEARRWLVQLLLTFPQSLGKSELEEGPSSAHFPRSSRPATLC